jgi:hypothetical protein
MAEELLKPRPRFTVDHIVDLPARLLKTYLRLSIPDLSQGGRFEEASGKRRKIWPRGRFGLIFGAKPIRRVCTDRLRR